MGARRRLGLVIGASSTGAWDVVSNVPDDVDVVALFERGDEVWADLQESLDDQLECVDVDWDSDLRPLALTGICTFADERLRLTARLAATAGLRFHSEGTAAALANKGRQRAALAGSPVGVRHRLVTSTAEAADAVESIGIPCLLKPVEGWASRGVVRLDPGEAVPGDVDLPAVVEELVPHLRHPRHPFLAGYLSVESFVVDGARYHQALTGRLPVTAPFRESGAVFPADLPPAAESMALAAVDTAFDLLEVDQGTFHTELLLGEDRCVIIEVNGRLGGFVDTLAKMATGGSLLQRSIAAALGEAPLPLPPAEKIAGVLMLHAANEVVVQHDPLPAAEMRALPGVTTLQVRTHRGAVIDPHEGTTAAVACCYVSAPDVAGIEQVAASLDRVLRAHTRFHPCEDPAQP
jgi:hypothetical protein